MRKRGLITTQYSVLGLPRWLSGFPGGFPPANARDTGDDPGSGRSPGEGNGNPLQYSCLGNSMDKRAEWAVIQGVARRLSMHTCTLGFFFVCFLNLPLTISVTQHQILPYMGTYFSSFQTQMLHNSTGHLSFT